MCCLPVRKICCIKGGGIRMKGMWKRKIAAVLAPVVRGNVLSEYPEIKEILKKVNETLDTAAITALNAKVDVNREEYEDVAEEYWESVCQQ